MFNWFDTMPELLKGAFLALLGFFFAVLWDIYKYHRDVTNRDSETLRALAGVLNENLGRIEKNLRILGHETDQIINDVPFVLLDITRVWNVLAINLPVKLVKNNKILEGIRTVAIQSDFLNQLISNRDNFRISQKALGSYKRTLLGYGAQIKQVINELKPVMETVQTELKVLK